MLLQWYSLLTVVTRNSYAITARKFKTVAETGVGRGSDRKRHREEDKGTWRNIQQKREIIMRGVKDRKQDND